MRRNPVKLDLSGKTYEAAPTFDVLGAIEETGIKPMEVVQDTIRGVARVSDLAKIVQAALVAGDKSFRMTYRECGQAILDEDHGIAKASTFAQEIILVAIGAAPREPLDASDSSGESGEGKASGSA